MSSRQIIKDLFGESAGYKVLKKQARERDKYFSITPGFYDGVISQGCFYCGDSLDDKKGTRLDRVDNRGHYTPDNVVGCCKHCNFAKRSMSAVEFLDWIERVSRNVEKVRELLPTLKNNRDSQ